MSNIDSLVFKLETGTQSDVSIEVGSVGIAVVDKSDTGTGTITLCLAGLAGRVVGAEIVESAVENAVKNAGIVKDTCVNFI